MISRSATIPVGRFAREHQRVGAGVDRVGDVRDLRAGGPRVVDHALEHLRGHDDGLVGADGLVHESALDARDALLGHFDAQVAAGHHDAVGRFEDFVDVVHALLVLDFRNDADVMMWRYQQCFR